MLFEELDRSLRSHLVCLQFFRWVCQPAQRAAELSWGEREDLVFDLLVVPDGIDEFHPRGRVIKAAGADLGGHAIVVELAHARDERSRFLEALRHGDDVLVDVAEVSRVFVHLRRVRTQPRHEARTARVAQWILAVGLVEAHTTRGELVDVRRLHQGMTVAAEGAVQIVRDDMQDVVFRSGKRSASDKKQREDESEHGALERSTPRFVSRDWLSISVQTAA